MDLKMTVISDDPRIRRIDNVCLAFQKLQVDVSTTNQSACQSVSCIAALRLSEDVIQGRLIKPEGTGRIDELHEIHCISLTSS
ncbi:hypothetical protein Y590_17890 [Methylobacterium sp. AMS5]|nr:hypothetical protein Y590_17890 [Methylobacterium sp. AMS5]